MLKAPFPYFGGKSKVAPLVWQALGDVAHYMEPFFGSGAVLLQRPGYNPARHTETVNDKNGFVSNAWRALKHDPDGVAEYCDYPVNHADLCARRRRMLAEIVDLLPKLIADDEFFDTKIAGYWIWGMCTWIGHGLTTPNGIPEISCKGRGVHAIGKRPHLGNKGIGVHAIGQVPFLAGKGKGITSVQNEVIYEWFRELQARLRRVRVVCGDWSQICGGNWQDKRGTVGMFFDPPYGVKDRDGVYGEHDDYEVADAVREWALSRSDNRNYRIVIAGYEEHDSLLEHGWTKHTWQTLGGYGNTARNGKSDNRGKVNRGREALYFSPHCLSENNQQVLGI